ncbi:hypothetical protein F4801DRAFT_539280, partial [Xylaria longipes]
DDVQSEDKLSRDIYARLSSELKDKYPPGTILWIVRPLYGLAESGLYWFKTYHQHHREKLKIQVSTYDPFRRTIGRGRHRRRRPFRRHHLPGVVVRRPRGRPSQAHPPQGLLPGHLGPKPGGGVPALFGRSARRLPPPYWGAVFGVSSGPWFPGGCVRRLRLALARSAML